MFFITGETLQVYFLGTAGAMPTPNRNPSCILVRRGSDTLLFDCGEGAQQQMMRAKTGFLVQGIFVSHWHADHFIGIFGLVQTLSFMGRTDPLHIYGPEGCHEFVQNIRQLFRHQIRFPLQSVQMDPFGTVPFSGYFVQAVPGYHGTPSLGYVLAEYPRPGRFDREKAITLGLSPGPLFGRLQAGEAVQVTRNGKTFTVYPGDVMGPSRPGRKIVYSGDTRPAYREWEGIACDADLLIHDATFEDEEAERARDVYHSTAGEAGEAARFLRASALALIHISSRYTGASNHLRDAKKYFSGSITAPGDLTVLNIPFRE